jgi:hypothetical protein
MASTKALPKTFSTGFGGTKFKEGDNWEADVSTTPIDPRSSFDDPQRSLAGKVSSYKIIEYTDYDLEKIGLDEFKESVLSTSIDPKYKIPKRARIYVTKTTEFLTKIPEFQKAVDSTRSAELKVEMDKYKRKKQEAWSELAKDVNGKTQADLTIMKDTYLRKKAQLERDLELAYEAQKKQFIINKEYNKHNVYLIPGTKLPAQPRLDVDSKTLVRTLDEIGTPIISSIKIPSTRKRHRFRDLIVKPGVGAPAAPVDPAAGAAGAAPAPPAPGAGAGAGTLRVGTPPKTSLQELIEKADIMGAISRKNNTGPLAGMSIYTGIDFKETLRTNTKRTITNGVSHVDTVDACSIKCSANNTCKAFVFVTDVTNRNGQNCWLLTQAAIETAAADEQPFVKKDNSVTGIKTIDLSTPQSPSGSPGGGGKRKTKRKPRRR